MTENTINASIKKIKYILDQNLEIPDFQRPYRWNENNVDLLLQDIYNSLKSNKPSYRIGSTILYKNENKYLIVDGQQRITTILLVFKVLNIDSNFIGKKLCKTLNYEYSESQQNIFNNYNLIKEWIEGKITNEKLEFYKYLVECCEFVEIVVNDLSEAFQMFDSQNGRGKELEAYNLLKAYHIRAMESETQETKINCDKRWEESAAMLKQVINEQLYRTRTWSKKVDAYGFDKSHIDEFKGITIDGQSGINFPFQNSLLLQYIVNKYSESIGLSVKDIKTRFINGDSENINPYSLINQNIINGKQFFDYIETYVEIYKQLFFEVKNDTLKEFKHFYSKYCENYSGSHRMGDSYLKEVYKSLIFIIFDKYGEIGLKEYYKTLYVLIYRLRLEKKQVRYDTAAKYPSEFFVYIEQSSDLNLQLLNQKAKEEINCEKEIEDIIPAFIEYGITITGIDLNRYNNEN